MVALSVSAPLHSVPARAVPELGASVCVPGGVYRLGDGGQRAASIAPVGIGRYPVAAAHVQRFAEETGHALGPAARRQFDVEQLADHPATGVTFADAVAFCRWAGRVLGCRVRLPTGDEWEAAARGGDGRPWPWGEVFDPTCCNTVESAWGWTVPVTAHPRGAAPTGAEQLAGNVWEWVADPADEDGWRVVRGGSYLDTGWGVRAARVLPADPERPTPTTGFRIAIEEAA